MATMTLPDNVRVVDLVKFARTHGKRVRWMPEGHRLKPTLEDVPNDSGCAHEQRPAHSTVTRLRPRLRVLDGRPQDGA